MNDPSPLGGRLSGRGRIVRAAAVLVVATVGCAGGPLRGRPATVGSLRTAVSNLEFENEKLRRALADLRAESTRLSDRLAQEEAANGELAAQLDEYRARLGADDDLFAAPGRAGGSSPGSRVSVPSRKPPFARIPGRIETLPNLDANPNDFEPVPSASRARRALDPESRAPALDNRWLPIARNANTVAR